MTATSATQTGYTQTTNKTTATKATSAYESATTPTQTQIAEIKTNEEPTKATTEVQNETQKPIITTQQELEIKQQTAQTISETEESPLATAIQESSQTQSVEQTKATGKMAEMQEKYKDVYTPIPETYSKADEELQTRKVHEAYPNYISGPEFLKIVSSFLEGTRIELGQKLTPAQEEAQKLDYAQAFQKAYDIFGGEEAFIEMQKGAHEIMKKYPVNTWGKDERVHNETELARFTNAATYEALEQGKTIEEARIYAGNLRSSFMDTSYSTINFLETLIKAGRTDQSTLDMFLSQDTQKSREEAYKVDFNSPNNSTMDLREYGIEGNWEFYKIHENQQDMIAEIEKKWNVPYKLDSY